MAEGSGRGFVVATDVGGTCTDAVVCAAGEPLAIGKALSTPPDFARGVLDSVRSAAEGMGRTLAELLAETTLFLHGSTIVDNALLTRSGAATGLLTTAGFEDTLLMTRGAYGRWGGLSEERIKRPVRTDRAPPLVPFERIRGVPERVDYKGAIVQPLDEAAIAEAIRTLVAVWKVEALAVCFLWSFTNPDHERRVREIAARLAPGLHVVLSHEIAPVPGEYERTSTTVISAYVGRLVHDYVMALARLLAEEGYAGALLVMQGYGGLVPATEAAARAVGMLECGPAAGVIGARYLGGVMGDKNIIACDMGGTTFKVGIVEDGAFAYAREPMVDRYHYVAPKIEVVSIGAGGGSIISLELGVTAPKVGPESAGARPGPVCYGLGGSEPTLTDVMVLIGYMDPARFLGGRIALDVDAARTAFRRRIAEPLGLAVEEAAAGVYRVAAAQMADLIHEITVERGLDPRDFVLHAFGGTAPLFAAVLAEELQVERLVIPYTASVNGAFGLVAADIVHEYAVTTTRPVPIPAEEVNAIFAPMVDRGHAQLARDGIMPADMAFDWSVDFRYGRQVHEVTTPVRTPTPLDEAGFAALVRSFEELYERRYGKGSAYREAGIEMTMFRLSARGRRPRPYLEALAIEGPDADAARIGRRDVLSIARGGLAPADIYDFARLRPGNLVRGPAVIHTPITTIVVPEHQAGRMDRYRNLIIELG